VVLAVPVVDVLLPDVVVGVTNELVDDEVLVELEEGNKELDEEVVEEPDEEDDCETPFFVYTDSRNPAPQSSNELPLHVKLQSVAGAETEPALKELPQ